MACSPQSWVQRLSLLGYLHGVALKHRHTTTPQEEKNQKQKKKKKKGRV